MAPPEAATDAFFDPDAPGRIGVPSLQLERLAPGRYRMLSRLGFRHRHYGEFVVPQQHQLEDYVTDLTSVPGAFTWLVPILGPHLPAALLHDGLVTDGGEPTHEGPAVNRQQADDIFRDAMRLVGTPRVRRYLIWTGVSLATVWQWRRPHGWWRSLMVAFFAILIGIGAVSTLDLLDVWDWLPWMGDRPWPVEFALGAVMAVVIPTVLAFAWLDRRTVARIAGIALAFLLHVTALIGLLLVVYQVAEWLVSSNDPPAAT